MTCHCADDDSGLVPSRCMDCEGNFLACPDCDAGTRCPRCGSDETYTTGEAL